MVQGSNPIWSRLHAWWFSNCGSLNNFWSAKLQLGPRMTDKDRSFPCICDLWRDIRPACTTLGLVFVITVHKPGPRSGWLQRRGESMLRRRSPATRCEISLCGISFSVPAEVRGMTVADWMIGHIEAYSYYHPGHSSAATHCNYNLTLKLSRKTWNTVIWPAMLIAKTGGGSMN